MPLEIRGSRCIGVFAVIYCSKNRQYAEYGYSCKLFRFRSCLSTICHAWIWYSTRRLYSAQTLNPFEPWNYFDFATNIPNHIMKIGVFFYTYVVHIQSGQPESVTRGIDRVIYEFYNVAIRALFQYARRSDSQISLHISIWCEHWAYTHSSIWGGHCSTTCSSLNICTKYYVYAVRRLLLGIPETFDRSDKNPYDE